MEFRDQIALEIFQRQFKDWDWGKAMDEDRGPLQTAMNKLATLAYIAADQFIIARGGARLRGLAGRVVTRTIDNNTVAVWFEPEEDAK